MSAFLSPLGGAGWQFFTNSGQVLTGGKIFTYEAGTTTNKPTYTTSAGNVAHTNPIILDASGRVPGGEIWLEKASPYKFIVKDSNDVLIGTYDNITAINSPTNLLSLTDFGAVGDGITNDTTAVTAAEAYIPIFAPPGTYLTTFANPTVLSGRQWGSGQIKTADGNKSAPYFSVISSPPTSLGNADSILTAFNGDISRVQFAVGHTIKGATTLGQPTTNYLYTFEAYPHYTQLYNTSGWNQGTADNAGRTAAVAYATKVFNAGQGDCVAYNASGFVTGTRAGSTSFLANPAASVINGGVSAGADGVYLNPAEWNCTDSGYDVAGVGLVNNFNRTNNTGAKNVVWMGYRAQSIGTKPVDAFLSAAGSGGFNNGLDLVTADFGTNQSAISLKASQRIYFNNSATPTGGSGVAWVTNVYGGEYVSYNSSLGLTTFYGQDAPQFAVARTASAVNYVSVNGAPAGLSPQFRAIGSDTNVNFGFMTKGTGSYFFYSNATASTVQFAISGSATSAVNYVTALGTVTGSGPGFTATGSDTNIDIKLNAKGTGVVDFGTQTDITAGASAGYMVIKVSGVSYKVPLYAI